MDEYIDGMPYVGGSWRPLLMFCDDLAAHNRYGICVTCEGAIKSTWQRDDPIYRSSDFDTPPYNPKARQ